MVADEAPDGAEWVAHGARCCARGKMANCRPQPSQLLFMRTIFARRYRDIGKKLTELTANCCPTQSGRSRAQIQPTFGACLHVTSQDCWKEASVRGMIRLVACVLPAVLASDVSAQPGRPNQGGELPERDALNAGTVTVITARSDVDHEL
jgi:hypothetical protein